MRTAQEAARQRQIEHLRSYDQHMAKMNRIDAADEAEYNRVQSALAARELERQQVYDNHRQREWADSPTPLSGMACVKEEETPMNIFEITFKWIAQNIPGFLKKKEAVESLKPLQFIKRKDNRYSVGVDNDLAQMKSAQYLDNIAEEGFKYAARGGYKPITLLKKAGKGLLKSAVPSGSDLASPFFFNTLEYTIGDKKTEDDKTQKIILDSLIDIGGTIVTGLIAAGIVFVVSAAIIATVPATAIAAPVLLGSALLLGTALDFGLELTGWKKPIKDNVNNWWDVNVEPVLDYAFNQPASVPAQPPIPNPTPPVAPASTPTPNEISNTNGQDNDE